MVDSESVDSRLERLRELLEELGRIRRAGREEYARSFERRLATQHAIQLAIQICVDIGAHLIAELGLRMPDDYKGVFESLREPAGLGPGLVEGLAAAAGMRNVLVHDYLGIYDARVWEALDRLDDLREFAVAVDRLTDEATEPAE